MAIIQFKVKYTEEQDVTRIIEVKSDQTFEDLHNAILKSIGFDNKQLSSFYLCDDDWNKGLEITLLDMSEGEIEMPTMNKSKISDYVTISGQKLIYIFDFQVLWSFQIESVNLKPKADPKIEYPNLCESIGKMPKQYAKEGKKLSSSKAFVPSAISTDFDPDFEELDPDSFASDSSIDFDDFDTESGGYDRYGDDNY